MSRKSFVGGNWKSFNNPTKVNALIEDLCTKVDIDERVDVIAAPTFLYLDRANEKLKSKLNIAAQNCSMTDDGAFTGEISAKGLYDFGIKWVILGHSERRALFGESSEIVSKKVVIALENGLNVIACVGETLEDRNTNNTNNVIAEQLSAVTKALSNSQERYANIVIAYEPVWAIGTGVVATPLQAQETHNFIRAWLKENVSQEVADSIRIIYGGSVKASNAGELFKQADIDGFLVGGASLVAEEFKNIVSATTVSKL